MNGFMVVVKKGSMFPDTFLLILDPQVGQLVIRAARYNVSCPVEFES